MLASYTMTRSFSGVNFVETIHATTLDWSNCRSPSRAKRRHALGIPQRVKRVPACYSVNGVMHIHPEMARMLRDKIAERVNTTAEKMMFERII